MPQIPSPPPGYNCEIKGFDNIPDTASSRMPVPGSKPTPIEDRVMDDSNTDRSPFGASIPGGGITAQEAWAGRGRPGRPR